MTVRVRSLGLFSDVGQASAPLRGGVGDPIMMLDGLGLATESTTQPFTTSTFLTSPTSTSFQLPEQELPPSDPVTEEPPPPPPEPDPETTFFPQTGAPPPGSECPAGTVRAPSGACVALPQDDVTDPFTPVPDATVPVGGTCPPGTILDPTGSFCSLPLLAPPDFIPPPPTGGGASSGDGQAAPPPVAAPPKQKLAVPLAIGGGLIALAIILRGG